MTTLVRTAAAAVAGACFIASLIILLQGHCCWDVVLWAAAAIIIAATLAQERRWLWFAHMLLVLQRRFVWQGDFRDRFEPDSYCHERTEISRSWPNTKDQIPYLVIRRCNTSHRRRLGLLRRSRPRANGAGRPGPVRDLLGRAAVAARRCTACGQRRLSRRPSRKQKRKGDSQWSRWSTTKTVTTSSLGTSVWTRASPAKSVEPWGEPEKAPQHLRREDPPAHAERDRPTLLRLLRDRQRDPPGRSEAWRAAHAIANGTISSMGRRLHLIRNPTHFS